MTASKSPRFHRPHFATIAAFSLMLVIGATTVSADGDRGHDSKRHKYDKRGHGHSSHSYRSYRSGHSRRGHASSHRDHDRRSRSYDRGDSHRSHGYRGHGRRSSHGHYRRGYESRHHGHYSGRYREYGYRSHHRYDDRNHDDHYRHHRRFSIPRLIGRVVARELANYVLDRHYYRAHDHYHDVYRFPVYVDGYVSYRPYAYCEGQYFSVGKFRHDGTYYWD